MRNLIILLSLLVLLPFAGEGWGVRSMAQTAPKRVVVLDAGHGNPRPGKVQNKVRRPGGRGSSAGRNMRI